MPAEARGRCLALLLLLVPAMAVYGTPSIRSFGTPTASTAYSCDFPCGIDLSWPTDSLCETACPQLARVGREILGPPNELSGQSVLRAGAKPMPAVPAGVFMVLVGFLCISFVNDRKVWLASLAGILWLGQTGLAAIPQAASHIISRKNSAQHSSDHGIVDWSAWRRRARSDVDGSQYIALLRHLAGIPALISSSISTSFASVRIMERPLRAPGVNAIDKRLAQSPECAIAGYTSNQTSPRACSARAAEHAVRFSPGFVFSNLARGPPQFD